MIGKTLTGVIVGGFAGDAWMPSCFDKTSQWLSSPNMFIFNLNQGNKWHSSYSSLNIWVNTYTDYDDLIDFGYHNALQFEYDDAVLTAKYSPSNDFVSEPTAFNFGFTSDSQTLRSIEVYKVNFGF